MYCFPNFRILKIIFRWILFCWMIFLAIFNISAYFINSIKTITIWPDQHSQKKICSEMENLKRFRLPFSFSKLIIIPKSTFFCLFVTDFEDERKKLQFRTCRILEMITEEIWNYYMSPTKKKESFPYVFFMGRALTGNKRSRRRRRKKPSSNMKEINEVIKVKRKPIQCYSWKPNKQTKSRKSFHIFFPTLHNIFQLFVWNRNKNFFFAAARQPRAKPVLRFHQHKQRMKTQQHQQAAGDEQHASSPRLVFDIVEFEGVGGFRRRRHANRLQRL